MCEKDDVRKFGAVATTVFFSVVVVLSVIGNVLVLSGVVYYKNLKSMTNTFLLNLALSDLVFTIGLPFWAYYDIYTWTFGDFGTELCKVVRFIFDVGFYSSTIFLTTMTIHRYMVVFHPMSTISWHCEYDSQVWKRVGAYLQNGFFLVSFAIISFCYLQILLQFLRPTSHTRHKTVPLIFITVVIFFLGWAPYNVALFLTTLCDRLLSPFDNCDACKTVDYMYYVSRLVAFSHCCLKPLFMGIKFQNHLRKPPHILPW
ncbi:chemokine XC receptor 1-like [Engraulis encrasicolus]|uniref:chemokine XC receptor 1-like n=1 Tax=Engraulis encrasicolus TaxID=184585 RepID=UPI002FD7088D